MVTEMSAEGMIMGHLPGSGAHGAGPTGGLTVDGRNPAPPGM